MCVITKLSQARICVSIVSIVFQLVGSHEGFFVISLSRLLAACAAAYEVRFALRLSAQLRRYDEFPPCQFWGMGKHCD
jgi:hypothetical protein